MLFKQIKSKRGSSTVYELLISLTLLTFVMMFPIGLFSYLRTKTKVNDIATLSMQSLEREGQLTPTLLSTINANLKDNDLPELGADGTIIITNMAVTTTDSNGIIQKSSSYSDCVVVNESDQEGVSNGYLKKYKNAYVGDNNVTYYDIKCHNRNCINYDKIVHLKGTDKYECPECHNVSDLELFNETNVVYMTIAVPITDKVEFMDRTMILLTLGTTNAEDSLAQSNSLLKINGQYYYTKTVYGAPERYYNKGVN